eukprot:2537338-Rhodomonas_salina.2
MPGTQLAYCCSLATRLLREMAYCTSASCLPGTEIADPRLLRRVRLRIFYAKPGTHVGYGAVLSQAVRCAVLTQAMVLRDGQYCDSVWYAMCGTEIAYAYAVLRSVELS